MRLYTVYYISVNCSLYMFRVVNPPIIRSTYNCNYSIWLWSNRLCYLPLSWNSWNGSSNWFDQCQMLQLQLYVLLMMGGVTTRNM